MTTRLLKRLCDVVLSVMALLLLSPALLLIAAVVRVQMGAPVIFRQSRAGHRGRSFLILKFRTMREAYGPDGQSLPDEERITPVGRFLRRTSLDELPELWNIVKGEMSLVGPRPLPIEYLGRYSSRHAQRHDVPPGLTGWTQCTFGSAPRTWEQRLDADIWYVDNWSLVLDMRIVILTFAALIRRHRSLADGASTAEEFGGSQRGGGGPTA